MVDLGVTAVRSRVTFGGESVTLGFLETLGDHSSRTISEAHSAWFMCSEVGLLLRLDRDGRMLGVLGVVRLEEGETRARVTVNPSYGL